MIDWKVSSLAAVMASALVLGCSESSNGGGSGGSGGEAPCAEECNDAACPAEIPPYPSFVCDKAGLACSYTFDGCVLDFACDGSSDPSTPEWKANAAADCEIPVACSIDGVPDGAACTTKTAKCDIPCSDCIMECGEDNRWHEVCPAQGDCG
jgi:hypothetical protein